MKGSLYGKYHVQLNESQWHVYLRMTPRVDCLGGLIAGSVRDLLIGNVAQGMASRDGSSWTLSTSLVDS